MQAPLFRTSIFPRSLHKSAFISFVAFASASALVGGCKKPSDVADEKVQADVVKIESELRQHADGSSALPLIGAATSNKDATPGELALAHLVAGQVELSAADEVFQRIDAQELRLERLLGNLNALVGQVRENDQTVAGLNAKIDKTKLAATSIDQGAAAAREGTAGVWFASDVAPIPALSAVEKSVADLTQQSEALKAKQADFEKQKTDAIQQAEQLTAKSEGASGKESVDLFTQAANLRKTSADLGAQSAETADKLAAVERELSVAKAEQTQLQAALMRFSDVSKQVASTSADLQNRIEEMTARSKAIVDGDAAAAPSKSAGDEAPAGSITAASDRIEQVSQDLAKLRADANGYLDKAESEFSSAAKLDHEIQTEFNKLVNNADLRTSQQRLAWQWMLDVHNDSNTDLDLAAVQQRYARLNADHAYYSAALLASDTAAANAIKAAGLNAPKSLDVADLADTVKSATASASDAFKKAEDLLDAAIGHTGSDMLKTLSNAANVDKMIEQYDRWAFARAMGDKEAGTYLQASKDLEAQLSAIEGLALPTPLPDEIAPPVTASTPATPTPATPASGAPTTAPAAEAPEAPGATTAPATAPAAP